MFHLSLLLSLFSVNCKVLQVTARTGDMDLFHSNTQSKMGSSLLMLCGQGSQGVQISTVPTALGFEAHDALVRIQLGADQDRPILDLCDIQA